MMTMATTMVADDDDNKFDGDGVTGDDDGAGVTGDDNNNDDNGDDNDNGNGAMGDGATGYDYDDDGDGRRRRRRRWRRWGASPETLWDTSGWVRAVTSAIKIRLTLDNTLV